MQKSFFAGIYARIVARKVYKWAKDPVRTQDKTFRNLISKAKNTAFGKDHHFDQIKTYEDFKKKVPVFDYEDLLPYINRIKEGEENVLWKGKPIYFAKTSGTTSGAK